MLDELKRQLTKYGITHQDHFVDFQVKYGGRREMNGFNPLNWGLIHPSPVYLLPMTISVLRTEYPSLLPLVQCVDADPQDAMFIDENGRIYDCCERAVFDSPRNLFLISTVLHGYIIDFEAYRQSKHSWPALRAEMSTISEYSDTLTVLYQWGDKIVRVCQGEVIAAYEKREVSPQSTSQTLNNSLSSNPWWKFW